MPGRAAAAAATRRRRDARRGSLDAVAALFLLRGTSAAAAAHSRLLLKLRLLEAAADQLSALLAPAPPARLRADESALVVAACRGLARDAALQAELSPAATGSGGGGGGGSADADLLRAARDGRPLHQVRRAAARRRRRVRAAAGGAAGGEPAGGVRRRERHPLGGRLRRPDEDAAEKYAGKAAESPFLRRVQLTSVPDEVADARAAAVAMGHALHECSLLANQQSLIRNSACLRVSLLQHLFTAVLPLPLPLDDPERERRCFWREEGVRHETQAQLLRLVSSSRSTTSPPPRRSS